MRIFYYRGVMEIEEDHNNQLYCTELIKEKKIVGCDIFIDVVSYNGVDVQVTSDGILLSDGGEDTPKVSISSDGLEEKYLNTYIQDSIRLKNGSFVSRTGLIFDSKTVCLFSPGNIMVEDDFAVYGDFYLKSESGSSNYIGGDLYVYGDCTIKSPLSVGGDIYIFGALTIDAKLVVKGELYVEKQEKNKNRRNVV